MAQPPADGNWLQQLATLTLGGVLGSVSVIATIVANRKKTAAETGKTSAETENIQVTAEVNLSDAAMRMVQRFEGEVQGLRDELKQVREGHRQEIAELKLQNRELKAAYDEANLERHHLQARCERLETRVNELTQNTDYTPLPEGGFDEETQIL